MYVIVFGIIIVFFLYLLLLGLRLCSECYFFMEYDRKIILFCKYVLILLNRSGFNEAVLINDVTKSTVVLF